MTGAMTEPDHILSTRGNATQLGAPVTGVAFSGEVAAFGCGDGQLYLAPAWRPVAVHKGAVFGLCAHPDGGFLTGGDDGALCATSLDGRVLPLAAFGRKWVEHVAAWAGKTPMIAAAVGREVHVMSPDGQMLHTLAHGSTVTGLAFDTKGKRVATSHYNGASLWFTAAGTRAKQLEWKGSHIGVALHPGGEAIVTAMQESALHGWRLPDGQHMRMAGYPAKCESLAFTHSGRWLATAGADALVLWPFFGGGPMGKAPTEFAQSEGIVKRVAVHPVQEIVAVGYDTGQVLIVDVKSETILPIAAPGRGSVTALEWSPNGTQLAVGTQTGFAAVIDLAGDR